MLDSMGADTLPNIGRDFLVFPIAELAAIPERSAGIFMLLKSGADNVTGRVIYVDCTTERVIPKMILWECQRNPRIVSHAPDFAAVKIYDPGEPFNLNQAVSMMEETAALVRKFQPAVLR